MAAAPKKNLGKIPCPDCKQPVALKQAASGKLSFACQEADCECTGYADQHSGAARKWMAALATPAPATGHPLPLVIEPAKPAPPRKPAPGPTPAPVPPTPPAKGGFDLGSLK